MGNSDNRNSADEIRQFMDRNGVSSEELYSILKDISRIDSDNRIREKVEKNEDLEGRCFCKPTHFGGPRFPEVKKFYKVLSARSENEYRVECLIFTEHPLYWFNYNAHMMGSAGDYYLGRFDFCSFAVESVLADKIREMEEITVEEFNGQACTYLGELLGLKWCPDHCHEGGKLPTDPDWLKKEKE